MKAAVRAITGNQLGKCTLIGRAQIPIVKFNDYSTGFNCDLTINGILPQKNSALLSLYGKYDERFRVMGFFVKEWAKVNEILGGDRSMLSSYAYLNMIIHYLQTVQPPVLPCLQKLFLSTEEEKEEWVEYWVRAKNEKVARKITGDPDAMYGFNGEYE